MATITASASILFCRPDWTPATRSFSISSSSTALPVWISTFAAFAQFSKARAISSARLSTGKNRPPRSKSILTPSSSMNPTSSVLKNCMKAWRRNLPLGPKASRNSSRGALLVRLQRPLPVMASLRPVWIFFSSRMVVAPAFAASPAAIRPDAPPPTTITRLPVRSKSDFLVFSVIIMA